MAKYIDADKIEYPYMTMSMWGLNSGDCHAYNEGVKAVEDRISAMPAADVLEIVRCKDCKHCAIREYDIIDELECEFFDVFTDPLDYCSKGEKKADNEK